jgi:hypothetical protein
VAPDVRDRMMKDLPAGIHLQPGELRIEFFGAEDLLRHLFELSQAMVNDFARFQSAIESAIGDVPAAHPPKANLAPGKIP